MAGSVISGQTALGRYPVTDAHVLICNGKEYSAFLESAR
jgi:hypothetical protein